LRVVLYSGREPLTLTFQPQLLESESRTIALSDYGLQPRQQGRHNRLGCLGCNKNCTAGRDRTIKCVQRTSFILKNLLMQYGMANADLHFTSPTVCTGKLQSSGLRGCYA
jgi:hypothetical protein